MNIFKQLFGSRKKDATTSGEESLDRPSPFIDSMSVDEGLFADYTAPEPAVEKGSSKGSQRADGYGRQIEDFASNSLSSVGFDAGYTYHNPDFKKSKIREIKSDFQALCKLEIDRLRGELGELTTQIAMLEQEEMMEATKAGLRNRKAEFDAAILRLQEEVYIAEDGLGLVRKAVDTYKEGFTRGYQLYLSEEMLDQKYRLS